MSNRFYLNLRFGDHNSSAFNFFGRFGDHGQNRSNFRARVHLNPYEHHTSRYNQIDKREAIRERKELSRISDDPKAYEAYLAWAVREAHTAAKLSNSPENTDRDRAIALRIRNEEGQVLIGGKRLPFVNSPQASDALNKAYNTAKGDVDKLKVFEETWQHAGQYKRGEQRDQFVIKIMAQLTEQRRESKSQEPAATKDDKLQDKTASLPEIKDAKSLIAGGGVLFDGNRNDNTYLVRAAEFLKKNGIDTSALDTALKNKKGDIGLSDSQSVALIESLRKLDGKEITPEQKKETEATLLAVAQSLDKNYERATTPQDVERTAAAKQAIEAARS